MAESLQFTSASISDRGLSEKRLQNEDSYLELQSHGVFAVADGVGGALAGDVASQMAVEILGEAFINLSPNDDPEDTMKIALERANSAIFQMSGDLPQLASMATTIVALHVSRDIATIAHVGDSRIYRVDKTGQLFRETRDHSVVEEEVRAGRMTREQAHVHPSRNVISRALGAEQTVEVDAKMMIVHPSTTFLLCSDGITRHVDDGEIASLMSSKKEPSEICARLKEICYSRGAEDNLTAVIVRFADDETEIANPGTEKEFVTVATARSPFDSVVGPAAGINAIHEIGMRDLNGDTETAPNDYGNGDYLLDDTIEPSASVETTDYESSKVTVPAQASAAETWRSEISERNLETENQRGGQSFSSRAVSTLAFLILGTILGLGAYHFLLRPEAPPVVQLPVITEMKSNNTALTSFEESRRQVDSDPTKYIAANAASPQIAEDYFLIARAFLLTGKYWDAKRFYGMANDRLSQAEASNAKTLAAEIAMALAIIESPAATEAFARDLAAGSVPTAMSGQNSNLAPDTNQSFR